jgi:hypothetical protein
MTAYKWKPLWKIALVEWKVKHVNNISIKQTAIALIWKKDRLLP